MKRRTVRRILARRRRDVERSAARNCRQKKPFTSKRIAKAYAKKLQTRFGDDLRPYRCVHCGEWHLSTADADSRAKIREAMNDHPNQGEAP